MSRIYCLFITALIFVAPSAIYSAKIGGRITNPTQLIDCKWINDDKEFNCESKLADKAQVNISSDQLPFEKSTGSGQISAQKNTIFVTLSSQVDFYTCLVVDYCLSGENANIKVEADFKTHQKFWSAHMEGQQKECREVVQTIYDKDGNKGKDATVTITAELLSLPSKFHFESVQLYENACKVRIEGDYRREYEYYRTSDSYLLVKDDLHGDDYFEEEESLQQFVNNWPDGVVTYVASLSDERTKILSDAFKAIQDVSCIRFTKAASTPTSGFYLSVIPNDALSDCHTDEIGIGQGRHIEMNLGSGCWQTSAIVHQLMHVLAFSHESNRPDRDFYVKYNAANVKPGKTFEFDVHETVTSPVTTFNLPYDYKSIMHFKDNAFANDGVKTLEVTRSAASAVKLGGDVLSELDKIKIQTAYCSQGPQWKCITDHCPYDSTCFNQDHGCKCITEPNGNPGSCLGIMERHFEKDCGPSQSSYGKTVEVGNYSRPLCICKLDGSVIEQGTCPMVLPKRIRAIQEDTKISKNVRVACAFGYRQLPDACEPVPEAVQLTLTAISLLIPDLPADDSITKLDGLKFSELAGWDEKLKDTSSDLYVKASKAVRFEVLRALSIIYNGDDSLITKTADFDKDSMKQEPWVNPFDAVRFSKSDSVEAHFDVSVLVYFTQPVYFDVAWLQTRIISIFGMDSAQRDNGFMLIHEKKPDTLVVDDDACRNFARPKCGSGEYCQRSYSLGKLTKCVAKKVEPVPPTPERPTFAPFTTLPTTVSPTEEPITTVAPDNGLTTLEIAMIAVSAGLAAIIIIILLCICCGCCKNEEKKEDQVEMAPMSPPMSPPPQIPQQIVIASGQSLRPSGLPRATHASPSPLSPPPAGYAPVQAPTQPQYYSNQGYKSPTPSREDELKGADF